MEKNTLIITKPNYFNYTIMLITVIILIPGIPILVVIKLFDLLNNEIFGYFRFVIGSILLIEVIFLYFTKNYYVIGKIFFNEDNMNIKIFAINKEFIIFYKDITNIELHYNSYERIKVNLLQKTPKKIEGWHNRIIIHYHQETLVYNFFLKDFVEEHNLFMLIIFLKERNIPLIESNLLKKD